MGRLRDGYESPLFHGIAAEFVELFGTEDVALWKFSEADSESSNDPLWDEYNPGPKYRRYNVMGMRTDQTRSQDTDSPNGLNPEFDATLHIARKHLDQSNVPFDVYGSQVAAGDVIMMFEKGDVQYYDILRVSRAGFVNNTDDWTSVECELKRRDKFTPNRKL